MYLCGKIRKKGENVMNILLNVPYSEKDLAKGKGAKWNPNIKSWYTDDIAKLPRLSQWAYPHNIICENLYILKMNHTCWKCKGSTEVVLFATDKSYAKEDTYKINTNIQILTYVEEMPENLKNYMKQFSYYPSYSRAIKATYYNNHCIQCNKVQGDNFLHEVPEQSFYKKLCYRDSAPISYAKIKNNFCIPLQADLPHYNQVRRSPELILAHMQTGIENRASLNISQRLINKLFNCSIKEADICIERL